MDKHLQPIARNHETIQTTQGIPGCASSGLEKSGAGSSCNEHRPFGALSTRSIADISHWPNAARVGIHCARCCLSPRIFLLTNRPIRSPRLCIVMRGVAGHAGRTDSCHRFWRRRSLPQIAWGTEGLVRPAKRSSTPNYSIDTVRRLNNPSRNPTAFFFLIGIDAFREIAQWRDARALLAECDFIVASRPGFSLRDVAESLPARIAPSICGHPSVSKTARKRRSGSSRRHAAPT